MYFYLKIYSYHALLSSSGLLDFELFVQEILSPVAKWIGIRKGIDHY